MHALSAQLVLAVTQNSKSFPHPQKSAIAIVRKIDQDGMLVLRICVNNLISNSLATERFASLKFYGGSDLGTLSTPGGYCRHVSYHLAAAFGSTRNGNSISAQGV